MAMLESHGPAVKPLIFVICQVATFRETMTGKKPSYQWIYFRNLQDMIFPPKKLGKSVLGSSFSPNMDMDQKTWIPQGGSLRQSICTMRLELPASQSDSAAAESRRWLPEPNKTLSSESPHSSISGLRQNESTWATPQDGNN